MSQGPTPQADMMVELKTLTKVEGKKFTFQNQKVMLTYKTHLPKEEFKQWLTTKINFEPTFCEIAHENGTDDKITPYEHSHVLINFGKRFQTQNARFFDVPSHDDRGNECEIHPHIQPITTMTRWHNTVRYIAKEDPECFHLLKDKMSPEEIINKIQDCKTTVDVIKTFFTESESGKRNWQDLESINRLRQQLPSEEDELFSLNPEELNYPWQVKLLDQLQYPCPKDNRKIIWYVDTKGNTGKTELGGSLSDRYPEKYQMIQGIGKYADFCMNLKGFRNKGWNGHCLFVNLARTIEQQEGFYTSLEAAKDGRITCNKYEGGNTRWRSGYVVVFANWYPKKDKLSDDRWDIRWITPQKESRLDDDELPPTID